MGKQNTKCKEFKPWEEYPEIWKTESRFWTWLRGGLRLGLWNKSPIKLSFKNQNVSPPPDDVETRAKTGTYCALSNEWTGKSKLDVDHKVGNVSLRSVDDILDFIMHLIPPKGELQLVSKEAHKIKSYAEKQGISFEEAVVQKRAIARIKQLSVDKQKEELVSFGYSKEDVRNADSRRQSYVKYFRENLNE